MKLLKPHIQTILVQEEQHEHVMGVDSFTRM